MISEAFPPNWADACFRSQTHKILEAHEYSLSQSSICFSSKLTAEDIEEVKNLHSEWFPIEYPDNFFTFISNGVIKVVVMKGAVTLERPKDSLDDSPRGYPKTLKVILGVGTFCIKPAKWKHLSCLEKLLSAFKVYHMCSLMSFGVLFEFRQLSLGTRLLSYLVVNILSSAEFSGVRYILLHVIDHNKSAIQFYKRNGFRTIKGRPEFYNIKGVKYNGFQLLKTLNKQD